MNDKINVINAKIHIFLSMYTVFSSLKGSAIDYSCKSSIFYLCSKIYSFYLRYSVINRLYVFLTEIRNTMMIIEYVKILGKSLFMNTPINDPANIIGIDTNK